MSIKHRIAVVPGDGIGKEIIPVTLEVLQAAIEPTQSRVGATEFPFGAALAEQMRAAGLAEVAVHPLTWGIATLYVGLK